MTNDIITQRIIELLEAGTIPWRKPWNSIVPTNLVSMKPYRGINALLLNAVSFESPYFLTFKQAKQLGGIVRRGEKGFPIVFWNFIKKETENSTEEIPLLRYYTVFNASQCDGLTVPALSANQFSPIAACESIVDAMPNRPTIEHVSNQAAYFPVADKITMPAKSTFASSEAYYATLFHELAHSTGHGQRLGRKGITDARVNFGSEEYSTEELCAEMGSSFLCGRAGVAAVTVENSASYIAGWLKKLRGDNRMVIKAAAQAQKATDYILGSTPPISTD